MKTPCKSRMEARQERTAGRDIPSLRALIKHPVASDFAALSVLQGLNYLAPLISLPYILLVVGVEGYGSITFALAFVGYFIIIADYGFTLTATRDIAGASGDAPKQARIYSTVLVVQLVLITVGFVVFSILLLLIPALTVNATLLYVAYGVVLGNVLLPVWFFQGVQRMGYITIISFSGQCVYLTLLLMLVKTAEDYVWVIASQGIGLCFAGILALATVRYKFGVLYVKPSLSNIRSQLQEGWSVFISRLFLNLYTTTSIVILGFLTSPTVVGQFSVADKVRGVFMVIPNAVNQALYPHLAREYSKNGWECLRKRLRRSSLLIVLCGAVLCGLAIIFREPIVATIAGRVDQRIAMLIAVLAFCLITQPLGAYYTNVLVIIGGVRVMRNILLGAAILSVTLAVPAITLFSAFGLAIMSVIVNALVIIAFFWALRRYGLRGHLSKTALPC